MSYIVFFDLDHTILKINSGEALLRRACKNGVLSTPKLIQAYILALLHKLKLIDPLTIIEKFAVWLTKYPVNDIENLCKETVEKDLIPAIRPQIIEELKRHKNKGADLIMLSSAITSVCSPLAKHLEMHHVICSELETINQNYTGLPKGGFCFREEKLKRMNEYLQTKIYTVEDSYYYGDSIDDLPVLQVVANPVCVNPDKRLEKIARKQNWVIHRWD